MINSVGIWAVLAAIHPEHSGFQPLDLLGLTSFDPVYGVAGGKSKETGGE